MSEKPEPFKIQGTENERKKVSADEVLNAIAKGRDIDIEYADIDGDLYIREIADKLEKDEKGNPVIKVNKRKLLFTRFSGFFYFFANEPSLLL